jgi:hypothetical protein
MIRKKTIFIIEGRTFYYKVMHFRFKNVGATYQRMVNKIFKNQLGKIMEGYIDDMLVKSMTFEQHSNIY